MKKYSTLILTICLLYLSPLYSTPDNQQYSIEFIKASGFIEAKIKAKLKMRSDTLYVGEYGAWHENDGWASYISNIEVRNSDNEVLKLQKRHRLKWIVNGDIKDGDLYIEYDISFPYALPEFNWPSGPRSTAAFYDGNGMMVLAESLFIYNSKKANTTLSFKLPKDWKIATPWNELGSNLEFGNQPLESLSKNVFVVGVYQEILIQEAGFISTLILLGYEEPNLSIIEPVYRMLLRHHIGVFNYKEKGRYLMVWFPDGEWQTGEGYPDSYVVVKPHPPSLIDTPFWANTMSHEVFHYWLGGKIEAQDWASSQWFSEGVTELFANLSLIRNKIISEQQFFNILQKHMVLYQHFRYKWGTPYEAISLIKAGSNKSEYNAAIYDAGTITALCMDIKIRTLTNNTKSLEDLLRLLYNKSFEQSELYTVAQVMELCSSLTGKDWSDFNKRYVYGTEFLPISELLKKAGLDVIISQSGVHIKKSDSATILEESLRHSIFGIEND